MAQVLQLPAAEPALSALSFGHLVSTPPCRPHSPLLVLLQGAAAWRTAHDQQMHTQSGQWVCCKHTQYRAAT